MANTLEFAHLPNTCQYTAKSDRGDYIIQVAWPLCWTEDRVAPENDPAPSTVYVVDGNAYFFTAVDVTRRLEFTHSTRTVVVGIGYPNTKCVYDHRRGPDLTPPTADGKYDIPLDGYGQPQDHLKFGEASIFLDYIKSDLMTHLHENLFPQVPLATSRKALFGHSYGGIFVLNALFTQPTLFNTYLACSPEIFWNDSSIEKEQEVAFLERENPVDPAPGLFFSWGSSANDLQQNPGESDEDWEERKSNAEDNRLKDSTNAMVKRLEKSSSIRSIETWEFVGEDHGSSAVTGLQLGIVKFLVDKL